MERLHCLLRTQKSECAISLSWLQGSGPTANSSIALDRFSIRIFYPSTEASLPVFIWYHGGGMVLGSLDAENAFCTRIAITARCAVVAVDYRLAPEHKFPAGHDDAWTGEYPVASRCG